MVGFSSVLSFLLIAWWVGGYSAEIRRVIVIEFAGIAALAGAGLVHVLWLRAAATWQAAAADALAPCCSGSW